ncbi:hypothetical protein LJ707_12730 [Mucilaginibacter sp. UR6-1]|uniref:hypothetical protein n=1 Tax=Mucilaginibacter sp. UR6-1 TaxID=1435643 RepID=UPI001E421D1E|nr:hypothetical protein [Mucilaginibacter sp. UR6-1]MCC8409797.1 hypothetical protein [Mucilaginibacter sp. UR6-1]
MKKINLTLWLLCLWVSIGYAQNTTTLPEGTIPTTPQFRIKNPADTSRQIWVNFPFYGTNRFYSATETNKLIQSASTSANKYADSVSTNGKNDTIAFFGVDVTKFGLKADSLPGSANANVKAFNKAAAYAVTKKLRLILPAGTIYVDSALNASGLRAVIGAGSNLTTIKIAPGTDLSRFPENRGVLKVEGSASLISSVSTAVKKGDTSVTLPVNVNLKRGDIVRLIDTVNSSFNLWRSYYKEGEYFIVRNAVSNSNKIVLDHPVSGNYTTLAGTKLYSVKMQQCDLKGFSLYAIPYTASTMNGIWLSYVFRSSVEDVAVYNAARANISVNQCLGLKFDHIYSYKFDEETNAASETSYGLAFNSGCQDMQVLNSDLFGARHGFATGGSYVNRFIYIKNTKSSSAREFGFNIHGNTQFAVIDGNNMPTGASIGGKDITFVNNNVGWNIGDVGNTINSPGTSLYINEPCGTAFNISGNIFRAKYINDDSKGVAMRLYKSVDTSAVFSFNNNTVLYDNMAMADNGVAYVLFVSYNLTYGTGKCNAQFNIKDNIFKTTDHIKRVLTAVNGTATSGSYFKDIIYEGNTTYGVALTDNYIDNKIYDGNKINETRWNGIVSRCGSNLTFVNNSFVNYCLSSVESANNQNAYRITDLINVKRSNNTGFNSGYSLWKASVENVGELRSGAESFPNSAPESTTNINIQGSYNYPIFSQGITTASVSLDVSSANKIRSYQLSGNDGQLNLRATNAPGQGPTISMWGRDFATSSSVGKMTLDIGGYENKGRLYFRQVNSTGNYIYPFEMDYAGNFGIGTSNGFTDTSRLADRLTVRSTVANNYILNLQNNSGNRLFTVANAGDYPVMLQKNSGNIVGYSLGRSNKNRFTFGLTATAESGANNGSNFIFYAWDDAGINPFTVFSANRATQSVSFKESPILINTPTGAAGTDSLLVKDDSSNAIRRIPANYYAVTANQPYFVKLTGSGNGTSNLITMPHGLTGITSNSVLSVTPRNAASVGIGYASVDASNVSITFLNPPPAGSNNLLFDIQIKP